MDYSIFLSRFDIQDRVVSIDMWLRANVPQVAYTWGDYGYAGRTVYFKFEIDLLVFRLRWGV